ncbi:MAG: hypothetical protein ACPL28_06220 [bacterium]
MIKFKNIPDEMALDIVDTLGIFELLYNLIEYQVYILNTEKYIPDWNYQEKKRQKTYLHKVEDLRMNLKNFLSEPVLFDSFFQIHKELINNSLFNSISTIINEEIGIYEHQISLNEKLKEDTKINQIYDSLSNKIDFDINSSITQGQALIKPFLRALNDTQNPVPIGLQFEIVSLLGALKDPRHAKTLFNLLKNTKVENTNLLSNIIYALGNVQFSKISEHLKEILQLPDYIDTPAGYKQPLYDIKSEAIWSAGKLGISGKNLINEMVKYISHKDNTIKIALAWAMGTIGKEEKKETGVVDIEILTTLLELLKDKNKKVFEESIYGLKVLEFYELIDSLNLDNIPATPILALKPSSIGLYELSETLYYLFNLKKPVVMAVTGDSGTGKTYFCEAIKYGFGDISNDDILYLMRDNPGHRTLFSRMIDKKFTKDFLDPQYYTIEMMDEINIAPYDVFFDFIKQNSHKKLIILDGWLDEIYFYQVLKTFYQFNYLDCVVNFRTTYSTRRINLETREGILERVRDCLRFIENPPIEETEFYRNGDVFVYNLDNSIGSRLSSGEIKEIFSRKKVGVWANYIHIGRFDKESKIIPAFEETLESKIENFQPLNDNKIAIEEKPIKIQTEHFARINNESPESQPNLLQTIKLYKSKPEQITYYSPGMIAYSDKNGRFGLLVGINNQNFFTQIEEEDISGLCVHNEFVCWVSPKSGVNALDFNKNRLLIFQTSANPSVIASDRYNIIATGENDGTIRIWNINSRITKVISGQRKAITGIVVKKNGLIVSSSVDGELRIWNLREGVVKIYKDARFATEKIGIYQYSDDVILLKDNSIFILNPEIDRLNSLKINGMNEATAFYPYYAGRIFAGFQNGNKSVFVAIEPQKEKSIYTIIGIKNDKITGILTMGPRIITASRDGLNIWGSEIYVRNELEKLKILKESKKRFYYHSMIF